MKAKYPDPSSPLKIGTRGSPLALAQAHETRERLMAAHGLGEEAFEVVIITTTGDRIQDRALSEIGGKGLFTKEIEQALLDCGIDIAVHSMKDMPVAQPAGLTLDCYLPREDARDAFVCPTLSAITELESGSVVGTSSLRRKAQLLYQRPDLKVVEFRGNVQTRLRKLNEGVAVATFLAVAGLNRLKSADVPAYPIEATDMLPAVAQGAIGIERREGDDVADALLEPLRDHDTAIRLSAERSFLAALDGSCQTPIAALAELVDGEIHFRGEILRPDGSDAIQMSQSAAFADGATLGQDMANSMIAKVGREFITG